MILKKNLLSPPRAIVLSFAAMILVGAALLSLPIASRDGQSVGFLNALFTATSANCVTGLIVVNTQAHWTAFGKAVILLLIQFGGLGLMTILTVAMVLAHRQVTLRNRLVIQASYNLESASGIVQLVRRIVLVTLCIESLGALLLALIFLSGGMPLPRALLQGVFHSVSAFCNAGFDNLGPDSLTPYQASLPMNLVIMGLIIAGGLGFTVWSELYLLVRNPSRKPLRQRVKHLSLHSKIVFVATAFLILAGAACFLLLEWSNPGTLGPLPVWQKVQAAFFQSVTLRTAGYNTIDQSALTDISQFLSSLLMLAGGSPASTAGGIKTVTLGVIFFAMLSVFRGRDSIEAFSRTLPLDLLQKALTVASAMLIVVVTSTMILHFTEQGSSAAHSFLDLLFESTSAAGTVGVTTGLTPHLSAPGKVVILICMFLGRLGPVTVVVALTMRLHASNVTLRYPEERVIIG